MKKIIVLLAVCVLTVRGHIHSASDKQKASESFRSRVGIDTWSYHRYYRLRNRDMKRPFCAHSSVLLKALK